MPYPRERELDPAASWETLVRTYRFAVPRRFNAGVHLCDRHAADPARAERPSLHYEDADGTRATYTFTQVRRQADRLANALAGLGVARGDRVGLWLPQRPETALAHVALYKLGAIALPLSVLFRADALRFRLAHSGARAVLLEADLLPVLEGVLADLPALETVLVVGPHGGPAPRLPDALAGRRVLAFDSVVAAARDTFTAVDTAADDPSLLIYTSGTTGQPKGALHAHRLLFGHLPGFECAHNLAPQPGDCHWSPADWSWIAGLMDVLVPAWHYGLPVVATPARGPYDPERALDVMRRYGVRNAFLPPAALKPMAQVPDVGGRWRLHLRSLLTGGEALGPALLDWIEANLGVTVNEAYGQTEINFCAGNCHPLFPVRPGSLGRPYPGFTMAVLDEDGREAPRGTLGEIAVRDTGNPVFFLGYWRDEAATAARFRDGWALTGDLGVQDTEGYLWFKGRADDLIISAGYRIGPAEVEGALMQHPAVAQCAVIGVPDGARGQAVKAYVVPRAGHAPAAGDADALTRDLQAFVRERLARHEYPRAVAYVDALPTTATGKVRRAELRRLAGETARLPAGERA